VVIDDAIHQASEPAEPAEPAAASKQSGDKKKDEQPGECASRETRGAASHINASKTLLPTHGLVLRSHVGHQAEKNGTEVADLLDELEDLTEQQKHISSKVDDVVSRLQEALEQSTHRWNSARAHGPDDDTRRPGKRARRSS
jgi:t-SNARE complex subunit (syntaxin)